MEISALLLIGAMAIQLQEKWVEIMAAFFVIGSHTYSSAGSENIDVQIVDNFSSPYGGTGATIDPSSTINVANPLTSGTPVNAIMNIGETSVLVGQFNDSIANDTGDFSSSTVTWGTEGTSSATVQEVGTTNLYDVYTDIPTGVTAGNFDLTINIIDTESTGSASLTETGNTAVVHDMSSITTSTQTITAGVQSTITLGTFTDSYAANTGFGLFASEKAQPSEYFTLGSLTNPTGATLGTPNITYDSTNNDFVITDTILYQGTDSSLIVTPPTVTLTGDAQAYTVSGSSFTVDVSNPFTMGTSTTTPAEQGNSVLVGTFTDAISTDSAGTNGDLSATATWNNGGPSGESTTITTTTVNGATVYDVYANAPTAASGNYQVALNITDGTYSLNNAAGNAVNVFNTGTITNEGNQTMTAGVGSTINLGEFTETYPGETGSDFTASATGLPSGVTAAIVPVTGHSDTFEIEATFTPTQSEIGLSNITPTITLNGTTFSESGSSITLTINNPLTASMAVNAITNISETSVLVGQFNDAIANDTGDFSSSTVTWGTEGASSATVQEVGTSNLYDVYSDTIPTGVTAGDYNLTINIIDTESTGSLSLTETGNSAAVHDMSSITTSTQTITAGVQSTITLGTFTDAYAQPNSAEQSDPSAYFTLGSLTNPTGTTLGTPNITYDSTNNDFVITDTILYQGTDSSLRVTPPTVTLTGDAQAYTVSGSSFTVDVNSPLSNATTATITGLIEGTSSGSIDVGSFNDAISNDNFTAVTINWGDGSSTSYGYAHPK